MPLLTITNSDVMLQRHYYPRRYDERTLLTMTLRCKAIINQEVMLQRHYYPQHYDARTLLTARLRHEGHQ